VIFQLEIQLQIHLLNNNCALFSEILGLGLNRSLGEYSGQNQEMNNPIAQSNLQLKNNIWREGKEGSTSSPLP
jgi:hypothetical protein